MSISFDVKESFSVENYCDIERKNQNIELKSFLVDDERKSIYCWNHKVESSFFTDLQSLCNKTQRDQKGLVSL